MISGESRDIYIDTFRFEGQNYGQIYMHIDFLLKEK